MDIFPLKNWGPRASKSGPKYAQTGYLVLPISPQDWLVVWIMLDQGWICVEIIKPDQFGNLSVKESQFRVPGVIGNTK